MVPEQTFMDRIEALRVLASRPFVVRSAARCPQHNTAVSNTGSTGPHTTGRAIDIGINGAAAYDLVRLAIACGFTGIGIHRQFIHLDDIADNAVIPRPRIWSY